MVLRNKPKKRTKRKKHSKASWTIPGWLLSVANVEVQQVLTLNFKCNKCGMIWEVRLSESKKLPDNYLHCPNGCNKEALNQAFL